LLQPIVAEAEMALSARGLSVSDPSNGILLTEGKYSRSPTRASNVFSLS